MIAKTQETAKLWNINLENARAVNQHIEKAAHMKKGGDLDQEIEVSLLEVAMEISRDREAEAEVENTPENCLKD